jgi:DNA-binding NarL/FixJ family response regulator
MCDVRSEPDYSVAEPLSGQLNTRRSLISRLAVSRREYQILMLIADGLADKEIAERVGISRFTVNKHVCSLLLKLQATSRTQAAVRAWKLGLID